MKAILSLLPRPSHFLGTEEGVMRPQNADINCALAFPDLYEVGMSYLGHKILYAIVNNTPGMCAERVFAPEPDAGKVLREAGLPLSTLESDIPLAEVDLLGFSITHELCCTNVLYMLDLAGIPLRTAERGDDLSQWPLVVAGGGCTVAAEPVAPFMDLMLLGEGERLIVDLLVLLRTAKAEGWSRSRTLVEASHIPGVYAPSLFVPSPEHPHRLLPTRPDLPRPARRIVADLDEADYPVQQVMPFGAVHNRLSLEIARGCTRGCRFCQAGMIYRPARERSLPNLHKLLDDCLTSTGFDEISFLSLSAGDFSALKTLFLHSAGRCAEEQISLSLPSLRVGSIDDAIMRRMADIRRTGATLAPEAGSQRLRDIINKGVTEEQLLLHVQKLFENGWQQVKLYFMIGLPGETDDDMHAITDLCRKVRDAAGRGMPRLQVTAAISPFVPKAHTPFQWEPQLSLSEIQRRIGLLRDDFRAHKNLKMRWHEPAMSQLEGLLSRGDRRLADVVESAYRRGAIFTDWAEHFSMEPWIEAMAEHNQTFETYTGPRDLDAPLPWDHLEAGISREFLLKERARAFEGRITDDCRYSACRNCGACDTVAGPSLLARDPHSTATHGNRLIFPQRDQESHAPHRDEEGRILCPERHKPTAPPAIEAALGVKAVRYRIWHSKEDEAAFISQLELQSLLERLMRRAGLPLTFSQGFHPLPLISFGRALPVSVESLAEWFSVTLRKPLTEAEVHTRLAPRMPTGIRLLRLESIPVNEKSIGAMAERFILSYPTPDSAHFAAWERFLALDTYLLTRDTKKGPRTADIRPLFHAVTFEGDDIHLTMDWSSVYISPLTLVRAITPLSPHEIKLLKVTATL